MAEKKKVKNTRERSKDSGKFVPDGTDKQFPKEHSISELDRPDSYKPREPKPVFPSEPVARQNLAENNPRPGEQILPPQIVRTPTDDGQ